MKTDASSAKVETWEFYSTVETPSSEELAALVSNHKLGKKVAFLYDSFKDTYVVKEEVVPGDPTRRTVIRKPEIYNAVRTIEKELNRQVRKDLLPQDKAEQEFTGVLKVALPLSTRIRSLLRLLYKRIKRTYLICWVYSAVSALKVSIEFFLFRIN